MKKSLLTNAEHTAMVMEYRATKDDFVFADIFAEVQDIAEKVAYKEWHKSEGLHLQKDDFVSVAYEGVLKAINTFDGEQGSNFVSYVKQHVLWAISDNIYKKSATKSEQFNKDSLSLDMPTGSGEATFMTAVEHQFATDVDGIFNSVVESMDSEENSFMDSVKTLVTDFAEVNADDSDLIKVVFSTILTEETPSAKTVNKALQSAMPEVKSATLRKRKSRAIERFTTFASDKGFSLDLSQF